MIEILLFTAAEVTLHNLKSSLTSEEFYSLNKSTTRLMASVRASKFVPTVTMPSLLVV